MLFTFKEKRFTKILRQENGWAAKEMDYYSSVNRSFTENRPLQVIVWSRAESTSAKAWWRPSQHPKPARHQLINFIDNATKNQGRCKLLWRNSAAVMSSPGDSSEVRQSFRVSTGRRAVSSSEVNCRVPAAYRAEFRWTVSVRPPNSPDLNPVDYAVWGALQQSVYRKSHSSLAVSNLDDLEDRVRTCWESLDQQIISKSIDWWSDSLKAVVRMNGGHIEQLLWISGSFAVSCSVCVA